MFIITLAALEKSSKKKETSYHKTRNAELQNNGTRNTGGTAEHPETVAEQRNIPE